MALQRTIRQDADSASRRRFLTGCGTVLAAGAAGCTGIVNSIADLALGEVNLFNETGDTLAGTVTVTDPAGETALSESFELSPSSDEGDESDEDGVRAYEDVWTDSGTYEASVELDGEVDGESTASTSFSIGNTDEEMLAVAVGGEEFDEPIAFRTGEQLSDFAES
jgi:hypothetical protein